MKVIEQMLARYGLAEGEDNTHALREVMQELALAGLQRAGFFNKAAFYGGTCLRIFHGLPRFSEDLDFSLFNAEPGFSLQPYFAALSEEFSGFGFEVEITQRKKAVKTAVVSAFLKKNASIYDVRIQGRRLLKIKFEVDTLPPGGFETEEKLLLEPYSFYVKCFSLPDLYAGKMHALLFRQWKSRVKGRDWFDFEWYVRQRIPLRLAHFEERARQSGDWLGDELSRSDLVSLLKEKIARLDVEAAREDVRPFLRSDKVLDIWNQDYFLALVDRLLVC